MPNIAPPSTNKTFRENFYQNRAKKNLSIFSESSLKLAIGVVLIIGIVITAMVLTESEQTQAKNFDKMRVYNVIFGSGGSPLINPSTVAVGIDGQIFVADDSKKISVFAETGRYLSSFSGPGSGLAELARPAAMSVGRDGGLYIADPEKEAVVVFNGSSEFRTRFTGDEPGQFKPTGIAVVDNGQVHVFNEKDQIFYSLNQKDKKLTPVAAEDKKVSPFNICGDMVWDPDTDTVWTIDVEKGEVVVVKDGEFQTAFGDEYLQAPGGIAYDRTKKLLFVSDSVKNRIVVFNDDGKYAGQFGNTGDDKNSFRFPEGLVMDQRGKLYVADRGNNRIVIYEYK